MKSFFVLLTLFLPFTIHAQQVVGLEYQGYPTGNVFAATYELHKNEHTSFDIRFGANLISERTEGEQDIEEGSGFGGSLGYRYYLNQSHNKWFGSLRTDLWFNNIEWTDLDQDVSGTTNITVLQPVFYAGYVFKSPLGFRFTPTVGGGFEFNIREDGRDVGEGPITLWGLQIGKEM